MKDQMKLDKASLYAKDIRIISLEKLVIQIGFDPTNVKPVKQLINKKNEDIAALKKQH